MGSAQVKVIMVAGASEDHTPSSRAARPVIERMGQDHGFSVTYTEDANQLNDANLARYDVFLMMNLYPFTLNAAQRGAIERFLAANTKAWVGIHAAGVAKADWPWFSTYLGGITFVGHPALQTATFLIEDGDHPVTRNLPASFRIRDEWYEFNANPRPNVHVLGKVDEGTYRQNRPAGDHPLVWTNPKYHRMVYISIGHDPADWSHPDYLKMVRDALLWAKPATTRADPTADARGLLLTPEKGTALVVDAAGRLRTRSAAGADARWRWMAGLPARR